MVHLAPQDIQKGHKAAQFGYYPSRNMLWATYFTNKNRRHFDSFYNIRISKSKIWVKLSFENGPPGPPGVTGEIFFFKKKLRNNILGNVCENGDDRSAQIDTR